MDYNATLNLPKTDFPMRASLPKREPELLPHIDEVYWLLMDQNKEKPAFILHDGPPFSNAGVHIGTAMNKILKDFIVRYQNMSGRYAPYVPGWDNHGMPIESAIIKKEKLDQKKLSIPEFRDACKDFAAHYLDVQRGQFIRLGVMGDWENPYLTMDPKFEAAETKIFGEMYEKGLIYKGLKPVYWCTHDKTALAEAEIEYRDDTCESVYVKFRVKDDKGKLGQYGNLQNMYFVIWTTTIWTLPGNVAIAVHPGLDYVVLKNGEETYIIAEALRESVAAAAGFEGAEILGTIKGHDLEYMTAAHPFLERDSLVICGTHVTAESGTGCVHTAPGHGAEDYIAGLSYKLPMPVPVDDAGMMTEEAGPVCAGLRYNKANEAILAHMKESGALLCSQTITHTYPHCWRCNSPILFRATPQWFASVDSIKDTACREVERVKWIPEWGKERMLSMVRERNDWCISRQRNWGLPIPVFYCGDCGKPVCTKETISALSERFAAEGSNVWWLHDAQTLLPEGFACPHCGGKSFQKETDTLDGWFDSGSSHDAVLRPRDELRWPADVYLEGADQFRGWFQSSLLTAVATGEGRAPYDTVIMHGWVVDGDGRKMSKSLGNGVDPNDVCAQNGADILRLWVSSSDYHSDVRISPAILKQLSDIYLKIRNTCRFLMGNLSDFDPNQCSPTQDLSPLDLWALEQLDNLRIRVREGYEKYEYHIIFHAIHNFCVLDMSNFYLDIVKDILYCEDAKNGKRRAVQTVLYRVLDNLVRLITPVLAFTAEEIWTYMPHHEGVSPKSPLLAGMPEILAGEKRQPDYIDTIYAIRPAVNKALEDARNDKLIGKSLEASVTLTVTPEIYQILSPHTGELASLLIVSAVTLREGGEPAISVERALGGKCERCWGYFETLGQSSAHPTLCPRCTDVVERISK